MVATESSALILPALELGFSIVALLTLRRDCFFIGEGGLAACPIHFNVPYLFIWLCQVLIGTLGIYNYGMWDLVPQPGNEPGPLDSEHRVLATGPPGKPPF